MHLGYPVTLVFSPIFSGTEHTEKVAQAFMDRMPFLSKNQFKSIKTERCPEMPFDRLFARQPR